MKNKRTLPLVATTVATLLAGATIATAQDSTAETAAGPSPAEGRMLEVDRDGDGHRGGRHGGRHHDGDGPRGGGHGDRHGGGNGGRGGNAMMMGLFGEVDSDDDGAVTQEEIDAFRTARVAGADASGDGTLSIDEFDTLYRELTRPRMVDAFQALDADGDGGISEAELDARVDSIVERMDRDDDGALTFEEHGRGRRGG